MAKKAAKRKTAVKSKTMAAMRRRGMSKGAAAKMASRAARKC
jgi:hypothetical protein